MPMIQGVFSNKMIGQEACSNFKTQSLYTIVWGALPTRQGVLVPVRRMFLQMHAVLIFWKSCPLSSFYLLFSLLSFMLGAEIAIGRYWECFALLNWVLETH